MAEEEEDAPDTPETGGHLAAIAIGCALATGFAGARLIEASAEGKLISLLVVGVGVVAVWTAVTRPQSYPTILLAYLPFSLAYPFPMLGLSGLNGSNLVIGGGLLAWLVSALRRHEGRPLIGFELLLLVYMVIGAVGVLHGALSAGELDVADLFIDYRTWVAPMLVFFIVRGVIEERSDAGAAVAVMCWVTFLVAILVWKEGVDLRGGRGIEEQRAVGVMGQANSMGAFLAYYGVPLLVVSLSRQPLLRRGAALVAFLVTARAIIFTYSRGALLALGVGSAAVVGLTHPLGLGLVGATALGARSATSFLPDAVKTRFGHTQENSGIYDDRLEAGLDTSAALRLNLWRGGLEMIRQHPLLGVGYHRFAHVVPQYAPQEIRDGDPRDAHNAYILLGAEMGLPALVVVLVLLAWTGVVGMGLYFGDSDPTVRVVALAGLGCLVAVMVSCMFGSRFADDALIGGFWGLAGLMFGLRSLPEDDDEGTDEEGDPA